jgi:hypothetical protein
MAENDATVAAPVQPMADGEGLAMAAGGLRGSIAWGRHDLLGLADRPMVEGSALLSCREAHSPR